MFTTLPKFTTLSSYRLLEVSSQVQMYADKDINKDKQMLVKVTKLLSSTIYLSIGPLVIFYRYSLVEQRTTVWNGKM